LQSASNAHARCIELSWVDAIVIKFPKPELGTKKIGCNFDNTGKLSSDGLQRCYYPTLQQNPESNIMQLERVLDQEPKSHTVLDSLIDE
jgi:hypothetical protein